MRSSKESDFIDTIDAGVKTMIDFGANDMMPHFIYSNLGVPGLDWQFENLRGIILKKCKNMEFNHQYLQR